MDALGFSQQPFTVAQAAAAGLSRHRLRRLVADGVLRRVVRGAYVDATVADDPGVRAAAVRLVVPPDAVVVGLTAAWLHGIGVLLPAHPDDPVPLEIARSAATSALRRPGVLARVRALAPGDVVQRGGVALTTLARTVTDLARDLERPHGLAYLDAALALGATRSQLGAAVETMAGLPWVDQARELVALADGRAESPGESWMRLRWYDAALPPLQLQVPVVELGREVARLDTALPERRFALEYDGERFHGPQRAAHDRARRRWLRERHRWDVLAVGKEAVLGRSYAFEAVVAQRTGLTPRLVPWQRRMRMPLSYRQALDARGRPDQRAASA